MRWVADPSDGLLAPASIGCWSGGPKGFGPIANAAGIRNRQTGVLLLFGARGDAPCFHLELVSVGGIDGDGETDGRSVLVVASPPELEDRYLYFFRQSKERSLVRGMARSCDLLKRGYQ